MAAGIGEPASGYVIRDHGDPAALHANRPWHAHSRAYMLALVGFMGIFLFGYDTGLGGGVIALKTFSHDFGITGTPTQVANLQGNVVSILQGGAFFGAIIGGQVEDRIGRKYALMVGCVIFIVGGIVQTAVTSGIGAGELLLQHKAIRSNDSLWRSFRCWTGSRSDVCR